MSGTFRSVRGNRNAKLFFLGLTASNIGTWVQFTAVAIIVDRLTGTTTSIGILSALQFGPMLVLGAWAGAVADRVDRRRMTIITQSLLALQAVALAVLDLTGNITIEWIYALTLRARRDQRASTTRRGEDSSPSSCRKTRSPTPSHSTRL